MGIPDYSAAGLTPVPSAYNSKDAKEKDSQSTEKKEFESKTAKAGNIAKTALSGAEADDVDEMVVIHIDTAKFTPRDRRGAVWAKRVPDMVKGVVDHSAKRDMLVPVFSEMEDEIPPPPPLYEGEFSGINRAIVKVATPVFRGLESLTHNLIRIVVEYCANEDIPRLGTYFISLPMDPLGIIRINQAISSVQGIRTEENQVFLSFFSNPKMEQALKIAESWINPVTEQSISFADKVWLLQLWELMSLAGEFNPIGALVTSPGSFPRIELLPLLLLNRKEVEKILSAITILQLQNNNIIACPSGVGLLPNLKELYINGNKLTHLSLPKNVKLERLNADSNALTSINLDGNIVLRELSLSGNKLTHLSLPKNVKLEVLWVGNNQLTSIDVVNNLSLKYLHLNKNLLTSLNVEKNKELKELLVDSNQLMSIDTRRNANLKVLSVQHNKIKTLDLRGNLQLILVYAAHNLIETLKLEGCVKLLELHILDNKLKSLNINGLNRVIYLSVSNNLFRWFTSDLGDRKLPIFLQLTKGTALIVPDKNGKKETHVFDQDQSNPITVFNKQMHVYYDNDSYVKAAQDHWRKVKDTAPYNSWQ